MEVVIIGGLEPHVVVADRQHDRQVTALGARHHGAGAGARARPQLDREQPAGAGGGRARRLLPERHAARRLRPDENLRDRLFEERARSRCRRWVVTAADSNGGDEQERDPTMASWASAQGGSVVPVQPTTRGGGRRSGALHCHRSPIEFGRQVPRLCSTHAKTQPPTLARSIQVGLARRPPGDRPLGRVGSIVGPQVGAGGGNRTHTSLAGLGILSPVRLPVSPPRRR